MIKIKKSRWIKSLKVKEVRNGEYLSTAGTILSKLFYADAKPEDFGTNSNGNQNQEYCRYCYQNGNFTDPDITVEQMIEKCVDIMKR